MRDGAAGFAVVLDKLDKLVTPAVVEVVVVDGTVVVVDEVLRIVNSSGLFETECRYVVKYGIISYWDTYLQFQAPPVQALWAEKALVTRSEFERLGGRLSAYFGALSRHKSWSEIHEKLR